MYEYPLKTPMLIMRILKIAKPRKASSTFIRSSLATGFNDCFVSMIKSSKSFILPAQD
jgi:hypothetical protein